MIADDHALLRYGLITLLATVPDIQVVGEAADGQQALEVYSQSRPDVILMDITMPRLDGIAVTQHIRKQDHTTQIIILSNYVDEKQVQAALAAGAVSYLLKSVTVDELTQAIYDAYNAKGRLAREATQALVKSIQQPPLVLLTAREREVLRLLAQGKSNREIAKALVIALPTVKRHVTSILSKFKVGSRTAALVLAMQYGLLDE